MKRLLFILTVTFFTIPSFGQFSDTSELNTFIRDSIKDRRPDKITAIQLQKALLGTTKFLKTASNFANTDLILNQDRTHKGNHNTLNLTSFGHMELRANNVDSTIRSQIILDSAEGVEVDAPGMYVYMDADGQFSVNSHSADYSTFGGLNVYPSGIQAASVAPDQSVTYNVINGSVNIGAQQNTWSSIDSIGLSKFQQGATFYNISNTMINGSMAQEYMRNEYYRQVDSSSFTIQRKHKVNLSLLNQTQFTQSYNGFAFSSGGSGNPSLSFKLVALPTTTDTTSYKPLSIDGNGNIKKMNSWSGTETITTVSANTTIDGTKKAYVVDTGSGNVTLSLNPGTLGNLVFSVKKKGADVHTVTISMTTGSIYADAGAQSSFTLSNPGEAVTIRLDGTNAYVF